MSGERQGDELVIDYEPPRLDPEAVTDREPHLELPVVDFSPDETDATEGKADATEAADAEDAGWVLEEVAFDPLDLDNDRSMAPAPASGSRLRHRHDEA